MKATKPISGILAWAGLLGAGAVWAVNMQLGQLLAYVDCRGSLKVSLLVSALCLVGATIAGAVSWRRSGREAPGVGPAATYRFASALSALAALIFMFALAMHVAASLVLSGCEV